MISNNWYAYYAAHMAIHKTANPSIRENDVYGRRTADDDRRRRMTDARVTTVDLLCSSTKQS